MGHTVRISDRLWVDLAAEAAKRRTTPSRLTDLAVRKELGFEPISKEVVDGEGN